MFKVGDRVEWIGESYGSLGLVPGAMATVSIVLEELMDVEWDDRLLNSNWATNGVARPNWSPIDKRFKVINLPIDPSKVQHTRAGWPVANVEKSDDDTRPIAADVFVGREWMRLTYSGDGRFVSRFDQGIDLVEAK